MLASALPKTGMGSFTGMTPAPTTGPTPAPSAPIQPTPSPSLEPPWVTDPRHPAGLFKDLLSAPGAAYRLDLAVTLDGGGETAHLSQTADVDGADYTWTEVVTTDTKTVEVDAVRKGPYYYTKLDTQPWVRRGAQPAYGVLGNLDAGAWAQMQYVGPEISRQQPDAPPSTAGQGLARGGRLDGLPGGRRAAHVHCLTCGSMTRAGRIGRASMRS